MRTSNLFGHLARVISLRQSIRRRPRRHHRLTSRFGLLPSLEHLEDRTLLASVSIEQLTSSVSGFNLEPAISGDGTTIAFKSNRDLTGNNAEAHLEFFLYDTTTGTLTQVTDKGGAPFDLSAPSLNHDGTKFAFPSAADLTGQNADGSSEIFLFDGILGTFMQVTDTIFVDSRNPSINGDGSRIAFESDANLTGDNADRNHEIFLFDVTAGSFTQVTDTKGMFNHDAAIDTDGTRIAYRNNERQILLFDAVTNSFTMVTSDASGSPSISGDGTKVAYEMSGEIFLFDATTGSTTPLTGALLSGGSSSFPSINGDGTKIAFQSNLDLAGDNPEGNPEVFLLDTTTNAFTQVTNDLPFSEWWGNNVTAIDSDGTKIAFQYDVDYVSGRIFYFDATTNSLIQVADDTIAIGGLSAISSDGTKIAFDYNLDLAGDNADRNRELFLFDSTTNTITQVTDTTGYYHYLYFSISDDGTKIALGSDANLTGDNPDGNPEVYLFDRTTSSFTQLTDSTGGEVLNPILSGDGKAILFSSQRELTGENADKNYEIYRLDLASGSLAQLTNTIGVYGSFASSVNFDGTKIAFTSWADLTGNNADLNREVFLYDIATSSFTQVTDGGGDGASISADGTKIAFNSSANLTGGNADGNSEIFYFDTKTSSVSQLTDITTGRSSGMPLISRDGTKIAFRSNANPTGNNTEGNEDVFVVDLNTGTFAQIADLAEDLQSVSVAINGDGTRIAFSSATNRMLGFFGGSELFLATVDYSVLDVHLFYNNSVHDGNSAAVTEADFNAIPADKDPLQFGRTGKFSNVSGYSRGINGLFIDVLELPGDGSGIDASDFVFKVGNDDFADTWAAAPAPTAIGVFPNVGPGGADRIYVTFADGAIVDTWLGITFLATPDTGLASNTTFFYGSVPGETGAAFVGQDEFFGRDAADMQAIAMDLFDAAGADNPSDVNRDGRVDAFDLQLIPVASGGGFNSNVLGAITPQASPPPLAAAAVDEAVAAEVAAEADTVPPPNVNSLGGYEAPADERVGREETTDRDLAFTTFATPEASTPLRHGLLAALVTGRLTL